MDKSELYEDIEENPKKVLEDAVKLKEVIKHPDIVIELLKASGEGHMTVEVDGDQVLLVRPLETKEDGISLIKK